MNPARVQTGLLGVIALVAVCTFGWLVMQPPADPAGAPGAGDTQMTELLEELRALRIELATRPTTAGNSRSGDGGLSRPALGRTDLDGDAMERLTAAIERLEHALRERAPTGEQGIGASIPASFLQYARSTVNWAEFLRIEQIYEHDGELANKEVQFLSSREVMERFGRPHSVYMNDGGMAWNYTQAPTEEEQELYYERDEEWLDVSLQLYDGYVLWIDMSR